MVCVCVWVCVCVGVCVCVCVCVLPVAALAFTVDWIWNKGFQDQEPPATDSVFQCQGEGQQVLLQ